MSRKLDLFDLLPETILFLIVSYLPFKDAAKTSILSKRWRYIWHATTNIEFIESFFRRPHMLHGGGRESQKRAFINYVGKWMMQYQEPKVDRFRLSFSCPNEFHIDIEQWIRVVVNRNVEELDLSFYWFGWEGRFPPYHATLFDLPSCLYEHGTLQSLILAACNLNDSMIKNFSSLKNLSLECIRLKETFFVNMLPNCPSLESLSLKRCVGLNEMNLEERTAMKLRKLCICHCSPLRSTIKISTPSLRFFKYSGSIQSLLLQHLTSIEEADIDFGYAYVRTDEFRYLLYIILWHLHLAKCLIVCSYVPQVLHNRLLDFIPPPVPLEARHLIMKVGLQERELPGILALLMYCPKLNTLTIKMGHVKFRDDGDPSVEFDFKAFCREREVGFQCLRENLKVIEVDLYQGMKSEQELLGYLLKEAQVLERITITTCKEMDPDDAYPDLYFRNALRVRDFEKASHNLLVSIL
ncbi:putative F-box/LRR-repeat protein At5g54820 [Macadamia integrifolia]|uniref:putative F-box/LRR-repeat protein At5g54820 n=1 Tax=Macadamia integrifolia TaxID=60698 RepID=UPI001C4FA377|nr:putative F-box/LRR-repeat protein At5g54820 [Macadamia integrifolia]